MSMINNPTELEQGAMPKKKKVPLNGQYDQVGPEGVGPNGQPVVPEGYVDETPAYQDREMDTSWQGEQMENNPLGLQQRQAQIAETFRKNLPQYEQGVYNIAQRQASDSLKNDMGDLRTKNSSRGLLHGGIQQGQSAQLQGRAASTLARQRGMINTMAEGVANQFDSHAANMAAGIAKNEMSINQALYQQSLASAQADQGMISNIMGGIGMAVGMSDERVKKDIENFDTSDFLDALTSYKYSYKDPKHGEGEHVGIMAQDLEKTDAGSKLVFDTPDGKAVNYGKAAPVMLAALAGLNKRLKQLEGNGDDDVG